MQTNANKYKQMQTNVNEQKQTIKQIGQQKRINQPPTTDQNQSINQSPKKRSTPFDFLFQFVPKIFSVYLRLFPLRTPALGACTGGAVQPGAETAGGG